MDQILLSYKFDIIKMPLGKLSRNQLNNGWRSWSNYTENPKEYVHFFEEWCWIVGNAFISWKNPFSGVSRENGIQSDLIFMESYPNRFKKEWTATHCIGLQRLLSRQRTIFVLRRKQFVIVWNGKECVLLNWERFFVFMNAFFK
jgi:hypothetical protein